MNDDFFLFHGTERVFRTNCNYAEKKTVKTVGIPYSKTKRYDELSRGKDADV